MSDASDDIYHDFIFRQKLRGIYVDDYKSNLEVEDEDDGELGLASDGLVPSSKDLVWVLGKCYYYDTINYSLFICTKGTFI